MNNNQNISLKEVQEEIKRIWEESLGQITVPPKVNDFQKLKIAWNNYHNNNEHNKECNCINIDNETIKKMAREVGLTSDVLRNGFRLLDNIEAFPDILRKFNNAEKGRSKISITKLLREKIMEEKRREIIEKAEEYVVTPEITILEGDFREVCKNEIPDNSIDMGLADPLYSEKFIHLLDPMAKEYARILKPGAYLLMYYGGMNEKAVLDSICPYLEYYTTISLIHEGSGEIIHFSDIIASYKPIYVFYKPPKRKIKPFKNVLFGKKDNSKTFHAYGQSVYESCELIKIFSNSGDTVCDVFAGGGTTAVAALLENRNCILVEQDPVQVQIIRGRLANLQEQLKIQANQIDKNDTTILN